MRVMAYIAGGPDVHNVRLVLFEALIVEDACAAVAFIAQGII
jgi:hypothetical protein